MSERRRRSVEVRARACRESAGTRPSSGTAGWVTGYRGVRRHHVLARVTRLWTMNRSQYRLPTVSVQWVCSRSCVKPRTCSLVQTHRRSTPADEGTAHDLRGARRRWTGWYAGIVDGGGLDTGRRRFPPTATPTTAPRRFRSCSSPSWSNAGWRPRMIRAEQYRRRSADSGVPMVSRGGRRLTPLQQEPEMANSALTGDRARTAIDARERLFASLDPFSPTPGSDRPTHHQRGGSHGA